MEGISKDEWVQQPYTIHLRKQAEKLRDEARDKLLLTCRTSTDTLIAKGYAQYSALEEQVKLLKGGER